ncbi:MAG: DUF3396 domain-containing protein [Candidatus Rokubacteria bacterium]|nr:DUF3396 domain-containing protein [Candidatus Rokubacteria bacterium]
MPPIVVPEALRVNDRETSLQVVSPAFDIVLYTNHNLSTVSEGILHAYDRFLTLCPAEELRWYCTETMRKHAACTDRALKLLRQWLRTGAPKRDVICIEIKGGEHYASTSDFAFWVYGDERGGSYERDAEMVRMCFPSAWGHQRSDEMLDLARDLCNHIPFRSGHAGYVLQTTRYAREKSYTAAWKLARRHPGLDIENELRDRLAVRDDGIKGVNWITMLCDEFVKRVGGRKKLDASLPKSMEVLPVQGGLVLKAGAEPSVGDVNRGDRVPLYRSVYRIVAPLQKPAIGRYGPFELPGDASEKTDAWLQRFAE